MKETKLRESPKAQSEPASDSNPSNTSTSTKRKRSRMNDDAKRTASKSPRVEVEQNEKKESIDQEVEQDEATTKFTLFVGQIPFDTKSKDLEEFFAEQGVAGISVRIGTNKKSRGTAFVTCEQEEQMKQLLALHNSKFQERTIVIEEAKSKEGDKLKKRTFTTQRVFIGQLPFEATIQTIQEHFEKHGAGKLQVRLLTDKKTGKSKGIAFADCESEKQLVRALRAHHTRLLGRVINVERTVGGGGKSPKRIEKLKQLKERQGSKVLKEVREVVERIITETPNCALTTEDVDDRALEALGTFPRDVMESLFKEYATIDFTGVNSKTAYLMGTIKRYREKLKGGEDFIPEESTYQSMKGKKNKGKVNMGKRNKKKWDNKRK